MKKAREERAFPFPFWFYALLPGPLMALLGIGVLLAASLLLGEPPRQVAQRELLPAACLLSAVLAVALVKASMLGRARRAARDYLTRAGHSDEWPRLEGRLLPQKRDGRVRRLSAELLGDARPGMQRLGHTVQALERAAVLVELWILAPCLGALWLLRLLVG